LHLNEKTTVKYLQIVVIVRNEVYREKLKKTSEFRIDIVVAMVDI